MADCISFGRLANTLLTGAVEQHRETALVNCFKTWDDNIDLEVIEQGILDRFRAMGVSNPGVYVNRISPIKLGVEVADMDLQSVICEYSIIGSVGSSPVARVKFTTLDNEKYKNFLHPEELRLMGNYLADNFYHH